MSIASEITRLQNAKTALKTSIENKGVTVSASALLDAYPAYVDSIQTGGGGGGDWETIAKGMIDKTTEFDIPSSLPVNPTNYSFYGIGGLKSVAIASNVTTIGQSSFSFCAKLASIVLPDSATSIGSYAFQSCTALENVTLGSGLQTIGQSAFQSTKIASITIPSAVTAMNTGCFRSCASLTEIIMQPTSPPTLGASAFLQSTNLASIYVPDASVNTYKGASGWSTYASIIKSINDKP